MRCHTLSSSFRTQTRESSSPYKQPHNAADREQTNKLYKLENALRDCILWKPARVPDSSEPDGFRNIGSMVRLQFVLE